MYKVARNIGRRLGKYIGKGGGDVSTPLIDRHPATAAYSLTDLGCKSGVITNSGDTVGTVINPTCRLRRHSDDAHRAFTGAEIAVGAHVSWANEDVVLRLPSGRM